MYFTHIGNLACDFAQDSIGNDPAAEYSCSHKNKILTDDGIGVSIARKLIARYHFKLS